MNRLFKWELYKLVRHKAFIICSVIVLAMNVFSLAAIKIMALILTENDFPEINFIIPVSGASAIFMTLGSSFSTIAGVFVAIFVCSDYEQETIKNVYSRGFSRSAVFFSKYVAAVVGTFCMYILAAILNFALGCLLFGFKGFAAEGSAAEFILRLITQILLVWAYTSLAFMFAILFKKIGASIALIIIAPMVISVIIMVVSAFFTSPETGATTLDLSVYWLDGILTNSSNGISAGIDGSIRVATIDNLRNILITIGYAALFTALGFLANSKSDK